MISDKKIMYDHSLGKENRDKWGEKIKLEKMPMSELPEHINEILNEIDTTLSLERTNQLLNAYFVVPHHGSDREPLTATLESIEANRQKVLLNVGSYGISEDSWKPIIDELQTMALQGRLLRYGGK